MIALWGIMAWQIFMTNEAGNRVLTALVEGDAELVSRLKLLATDLKLTVEVVEVPEKMVPESE